MLTNENRGEKVQEKVSKNILKLIDMVGCENVAISATYMPKHYCNDVSMDMLLNEIRQDFK